MDPCRVQGWWNRRYLHPAGTTGEKHTNLHNMCQALSHSFDRTLMNNLTDELHSLVNSLLQVKHSFHFCVCRKIWIANYFQALVTHLHVLRRWLNICTYLYFKLWSILLSMMILALCTEWETVIKRLDIQFHYCFKL